MTSRWVYTWKVTGGVGGELIVKARLCVKGFQDALAATLATIAATASLIPKKFVMMEMHLLNLNVSTDYKHVQCAVKTVFKNGRSQAPIAAMGCSTLKRSVTTETSLPKWNVNTAL